MGPRGVPNNVQNRGVPMFFTPEFIASYNLRSAQNAANQANEQRYQQAMSELVNLRRQNMADVGSMGASYRSEIMQKSQADLAAIRQEMTQRGLAHSTVLPAVLAGAARNRNRDLLALYDQLNQARMNARSQATGQIVNLIASKNEMAPDPRMAASLGQGLGAGGGGGFGMAQAMAMQQQAMAMNPMAAWQQHMARLAALSGGGGGPSRMPGYQGPMRRPATVAPPPPTRGGNWDWWNRPRPGASYVPGQAAQFLINQPAGPVPMPGQPGYLRDPYGGTAFNFGDFGA